jgi:hypothetical protein
LTFAFWCLSARKASPAGPAVKAEPAAIMTARPAKRQMLIGKNTASRETRLPEEPAGWFRLRILFVPIMSFS